MEASRMRMSLVSILLAGAVFTGVGMVHASEHGLRAEEVKRAQREPVDANALYGNLREKLEVVCTSAMVSSEVTNAGHKLARDRNRLERRLTFSLDLKILDSSNLVGLDVNHPVILTAVDGDSTDIRWLPRSYPVREYRAAKGFGGWGSVQLPRAVVQLILAPSQAIPASVAELTGYFHALYAEKVIEVDIPFEPNHPWIDAAPDLRIAVTVDSPPTTRSDRVSDLHSVRFTSPLHRTDSAPCVVRISHARAVDDRAGRSCPGRSLDHGGFVVAGGLRGHRNRAL